MSAITVGHCDICGAVLDVGPADREPDEANLQRHAQWHADSYKRIAEELWRRTGARLDEEGRCPSRQRPGGQASPAAQPQP